MATYNNIKKIKIGDNIYNLYDSGNSGGTVTSVATGAGLTGGTITTSGTIKHSNSVTAQTTQAVYPIKIDACGHISAYGSAQTILSLGTTASTAAKGNHTHSLSIATDTGTNQLTMAASTKYKLTAGGSTYIFTTPPDNNTTYSAGTGLSLSSTTFNHSNSVTAKTAAAGSASTLTWGGTFTIYEEKYDAQGHITGVASYNKTMPANPNTDQKASSSNSTSKLFLIGATSQSSSGVATYSNSGLHATGGNLTANNFLATLTYSGTPPAATGADADLVNAIYKLGWQSSCIV